MTDLYRNVQRFRGGLVFKARRLLYHSTLGLRVIKKMKKDLYCTPSMSTCDYSEEVAGVMGVDDVFLKPLSSDLGTNQAAKARSPCLESFGAEVCKPI